MNNLERVKKYMISNRRYLKPIDDYVFDTLTDIVCEIISKGKLIVGPNDVKSSTRKYHVVRARVVCFWIAHYCYNSTLDRIGEYYNRKHHRQIRDGYQSVENQYKYHKEFRVEFDNILKYTININIMVRTFSTTFPNSHPKEGQPTLFVESIKSGDKKHTFRIGYSFINGYKLSRRIWTGTPYNSPQFQFVEDTIGYTQNFVIIRTKKHFEVWVESKGKYKRINASIAAKNDGLSLEDFKAWFPKTVQGQIIHWTDLRY